MLTSQRKKIIPKNWPRMAVLAKQLSEMFGLSEDTVRRDLRELDAEGLLQRVHGGALPVSLPLPASPSAISWNPAPNARSPKPQRR